MSSAENARYGDRKRSPSAFDPCIVRLLQTIFHFGSLSLGETISSATRSRLVVCCCALAGILTDSEMGPNSFNLHDPARVFSLEETSHRWHRRRSGGSRLSVCNRSLSGFRLSLVYTYAYIHINISSNRPYANGVLTWC